MKKFFLILLLLSTVKISISQCYIQIRSTIVNESMYNAHDGSIDITVSGGYAPYNFLWSNGDTTEDINNLSAGTYVVSIKSVNEINWCNNFTIVVAMDSTNFPCNMQISSLVTNTSGPNEMDGAIDLTVIGGNPPYAFLWENNNETTEDISNLSSGIWTVYIESVNDSTCSTYYDIYVGVDSNYTPCSISINCNVYHVSVIGGNDGSIDLTVSGSNPPYTFLWSNGETTEDIFNLTSGYYSVTIMDSMQNCFATYAAWVIEPYMDSTIIDTLQTSLLDTCLGFQVDSFFINSINVNGNIVTVNWVFIGGGTLVYLPIEYDFRFYGSQIVILSINCPYKKSLTTYTTYINIRQGMGIIENNSLGTIYPYPNPANSSLSIDLPTDYSDNVTIKLYNNMGALILSTKYKSKTSFNIESLSPGFYYINLTDNQSNLQSIGKFIKQ